MLLLLFFLLILNYCQPAVEIYLRITFRKMLWALHWRCQCGTHLGCCVIYLLKCFWGKSIHWECLVYKLVLGHQTLQFHYWLWLALAVAKHWNAFRCNHYFMFIAYKSEWILNANQVIWFRLLQLMYKWTIYIRKWKLVIEMEAEKFNWSLCKN